MKNIDLKRTLAGISAVALAASLSACGGGSSSGGSGNAPVETTAAETTEAVTVAINTAAISDEDLESIDSASDVLRDVELENKEIKWLSHWDINPDSSGKSVPVALSMFQSKYGGSVKWYQTSWENRYNDLSTYVLGGEGIDFFQRDESSLPKGIVSGMFQPIDDYIEFYSPLYDKVRTAMNLFSFKDKHYAFVNEVTSDGVVIYSAKTIDENGFDDPWDMYLDGRWNWETFTDMLSEFCDPAAEKYGLDGWWTEKPLYLSAGVPAVSSAKGKLQVNLKDPTLEKAQNWMYSLYTKGLVFDKTLYGGNPQVQLMGEGKELFFICAPWALMSAPETWECKIDPEDARWVPVPCPAGADKEWYAATAGGYCLCKGAANPLGVALYVECELATANDADTKAISIQKQKDDFKWNDTMIKQLEEINKQAREHPIMEMADGVSSDLSTILTYSDSQGLKAAMHGTEWSFTRESTDLIVEEMVKEFNSQLDNVT